MNKTADIRAYRAEYRAKNRARLAQKARESYRRNRAARLETSKAYQRKNADKYQEMQRHWRESNPEYHRRWIASHPGYFRAFYARNQERLRAGNRWRSRLARPPKVMGPPARLDPLHTARVERKYREKLGLGYVRGQLAKRSKLRQKNIPLSLVQVRRLQILIHRHLKGDTK